MKVLLDECLPIKLKNDFLDHEIFTVSEMGWTGVKNGKLLSLLESNGFSVFITVDRNLSFQQNLDQLKIAVIVLHAKNNRYTELTTLIPKIMTALAQNPPPGVIHVT